LPDAIRQLLQAAAEKRRADDLSWTVEGFCESGRSPKLISDFSNLPSFFLACGETA
jgi:hypothetical protein